MPSTTSTWCDLPLELLELILQMLTFIDIFRFKSVCSCWKRAAESYTSSPYFFEAPWLLVPPDHQQEHTDDNDVDHYFRFFSLSEKKFIKIKTSFEGFDCPGLKCAGSSHGWLAICSFYNDTVYLLNPLSGSKIDLPSLSTLPYFMRIWDGRVHQVVPSSDLSRSNKFFVVVRYTTYEEQMRLAFCKNGVERWSNLGWHESCVSVTFHKGHLYSLGMEDLKVYDFGGTYPMQTMDLRHGSRERPTCRSCVITVDSWGELYLLVNPDFTSKEWIRGASFFFKLNLTSKEWEKVEKLNDQAIF